MLTATSVELANDAYRVVRTHEVGESRGLTILILFKVDRPSLAEAFEDLYAGAELPPDRPHALTHVVHESSKQNFLLFAFPRVTVRADVVEFLPAAGESGGVLLDEPGAAAGPAPRPIDAPIDGGDGNGLER